MFTAIRKTQRIHREIFPGDGTCARNLTVVRPDLVFSGRYLVFGETVSLNGNGGVFTQKQRGWRVGGGGANVLKYCVYEILLMFCGRFPLKRSC